MYDSVLTSSFFIFLASLGPLLPGVVAEAAPADAADVGELGLRLSLTLLACEADPGLRAEDDLSRGEIEVRCKREKETDIVKTVSPFFFLRSPSQRRRRGNGNVTRCRAAACGARKGKIILRKVQ